ncbi:MAG: hydroxyethylthiazole kinase-like uncharacterized protein yjeF [Pseudohongiellaceae bacterium]|jgi:hydroxyethylthiazole kinase-like uncharacterized protein yjeF
MDCLPLAPWPRRQNDTHKGTYGTVLVIAGCRSYPGAAILAALGAARLGAGLVRLAVPQGIVAEVLPAVPFATVLRCPETPEGGLALEAAGALLAAARTSQAVVIGPGLGTARASGELLAAVVPDLAAPLVVDADALNLLVGLGAPQLLTPRAQPTVLTPHPGEFGRLTESPAPSGDAARARAATTLAQDLGVVVALKGHHTVVTDGRRLYAEPAGNPGMATGGMGDVLAGAIAAVLARENHSASEDPAADTALAVHLHARAGDLAAADLGQDGLLPQDVAERLGFAAREIQQKTQR